MRFFFIYLFCRCGWYFIPACEGKNITYPVISGIINIKSAPYNAVGDGVTNDTAFQVALTASGSGNTIYIPNGTYRGEAWKGEFKEAVWFAHVENEEKRNEKRRLG